MQSRSDLCRNLASTKGCNRQDCRFVYDGNARAHQLGPTAQGSQIQWQSLASKDQFLRHLSVTSCLGSLCQSQLLITACSYCRVAQQLKVELDIASAGAL